MRVARARWFSVAIATMAWSSVWSGGVLAQDTAIPFRPACEFVSADAVSAVLGVDVTPADSMPDAYCSYGHGAKQVAEVGLSTSPPFVLARLALPRATDVTVGGLPALSSPGGGSGGQFASAIVGLPDGGILEVRVEFRTAVADPQAAARALAEAILATGPVTAHASVSTAEPIVPAGSPCELVTLGELRRITGQPLTDARLDVNQIRCSYRTKDELAVVSLSIGAGDLGIVRSGNTRTLTVGDREAVFSPAIRILFVDLGGGQLLGVRMEAAGRGFMAKGLPALRVAIAETAMGRMTPGAITCSLIPTDVLLSASGLDLQPIAKAGPDSCWFVTPDEQTGLFLRIAARGDVAYVREGLSSSFPDLPTPTDLEVSGHPSSGTTGASGTVLGVDLDGSSGQDGKVLFAVLVSADPSVTDPLAVLESVAAQVLDRM
jgi:hypothetical protein